MEKQTDGETDRWRNRQMEKQTDGETDRWRNRQMEKQTEGETDRGRNRQKMDGQIDDGWTDRKTDMLGTDG